MFVFLYFCASGKHNSIIIYYNVYLFYDIGLESLRDISFD